MRSNVLCRELPRLSSLTLDLTLDLTLNIRVPLTDSQVEVPLKCVP